MRKKVILMIILIVMIISIDQIIKIVALNNFAEQELNLGIIDLTYSKNTGIALGMNKENIFTTIGMQIFVIAIIVLFLLRQFKNMDTKRTIFISMVLAGGISNLLDRIIYGGVIDYIKINSIIPSFPVFNISDCIIIIGLIAFAICTFKDLSNIQSGEFSREERRKRKENE